MLDRIAEVLGDLSLYGLEKLGLYYSQYRGWVFDNADPSGLHRLKVSVPEVYGDGIPDIWAWPASNFSGKDYGVQCLPQKNDLIWVRFEKGNPRKPLWSYGYFTKGSIPPELKGPGKYWFRSPKGITILIDDNNKTISQYENGKELQPMVLGGTLQSKLEDLVDLLKAAKINTNLGPQGFLPIFQEQLDQFKENLKDIKSNNNALS